MTTPSRRDLIRKFSFGAGAVGATALLASRAAARTRALNNKTLVTVFLRGGQDGLSLCPPVVPVGTQWPNGDPHYQAARGPLAIPSPSGSNQVQALDNCFALGPGPRELKQLYDLNELAFIHLVGMKNASFSHFQAMYNMETANDPLAPNPQQTDGWAARWMQQFTSAALLRGMGHSSVLPRTLVGAPNTLPISDPLNYDFTDSVGPINTKTKRKATHRDMYSSMLAPEPIASGGLSTLDTVDMINTPGLFDTTNQSSYYVNPTQPHPVGDMFWKTAQLIKAQGSTGLQGMQLDSVVIDIGSWDHHFNLSPNAYDPHGVGIYAKHERLARALVAFRNELAASHANDYIVIVMSEFGRRVAYNGTGTDHGHGNCWMVLGSGVNGGQVFADDWQTNHVNQTDMQAVMRTDGNLEIRTDYRDVLGEILVDGFNLDPMDLPLVFPDASYTYAPIGLIN